MTFGSAQIDNSKRSGCSCCSLFERHLEEWQPTLMFVLMGRASRLHALLKGRRRGQTHYVLQEVAHRIYQEG